MGYRGRHRARPCRTRGDRRVDVERRGAVRLPRALVAGPAIHHVGYVVRDMASALERFTTEGAELLIGPTDDPVQKVTCALLRLAEGIDIELVAAIDPDDSPVSARLRRGGGLDHICLAVDDVPTA